MPLGKLLQKCAPLSDRFGPTPTLYQGRGKQPKITFDIMFGFEMYPVLCYLSSLLCNRRGSRYNGPKIRWNNNFFLSAQVANLPLSCRIAAFQTCNRIIYFPFLKHVAIRAFHRTNDNTIIWPCSYNWNVLSLQMGFWHKHFPLNRWPLLQGTPNVLDKWPYVCCGCPWASFEVDLGERYGRLNYQKVAKTLQSSNTLYCQFSISYHVCFFVVWNRLLFGNWVLIAVHDRFTVFDTTRINNMVHIRNTSPKNVLAWF